VIDPWPENVSKAFEANAKATFALFVPLSDDELSRIINCKFAFEI